MKEKHWKKKNIVWGVLLVIAVILVLVLFLNRNTVRIVFHNVFSPSVELDESEEWTNGRSYEGIPYSAVSESDYLHLYVPESEEPMPLLILVHGGGFYFNDCESRQAQLMYRYFRDQGYACASINYRLASEAGYPAALEDVKAAVRFLRANAKQYGYDPDKFAIWGESAGGYLAVMAGVTGEEEFNDLAFLGEEDLADPVSSEVSVILDFYGAVELGRKDSGYEELGVPQWIVELAGLWLADALKGTDYDTVEDAWLQRNTGEMTEEELDQINPAYYVKKNLDSDTEKNILVWHGDADLDVPCLQSERFAELMEETVGKEKVSYELFHNYKHAADLFYSDEELSRIKTYMDDIFEIGGIR